MIIFRETDFLGLLELGFRDIIPTHYNELSDQKFELSPDYEKYINLDKLGMLSTFIALDNTRVKSQLIGYATFISAPHLHYSTSTWAHEDLYYLIPESRKGLTGYRWLKYITTQMEKRSDKVIMGTKICADNSILLERLGYKMFEKLYSKVTNNGPKMV